MIFKRLLSRFQRGDTVLIRSLQRRDRLWLTDPLEPGHKTGISSDFINHDSIIGLKSRNLVKSERNQDNYIVLEPSTEDYINLVKRQATPIYPFDAASIVNLADLHVDYPKLNDQNELIGSPLQFLEAGTGHGSLTLAICGRIHAANCYVEKFGQRGAILHSIDNNESHLNRGSKNLKNFKRGMYKNDVEFHLSGSPTEWLINESLNYRNLETFEESSTDQDKLEFLSGAFLDMADLTENISQISTNLKQDAPLVIFAPSVTQILDVIKHVKDDKEIKLTHIRTIQIMPGIGGGLQEWDVRFTKIRSSEETGIVCRPKVGSRVVGGGFVGIFKKLPNDSIRKL